MVNASPTAYDPSLSDQRYSDLRQQFTGERRGLAELSRILREREQELREKLKPEQTPQ